MVLLCAPIYLFFKSQLRLMKGAKGATRIVHNKHHSDPAPDQHIPTIEKESRPTANAVQFIAVQYL